MLCKFNEKILTVLDAPDEKDAFERMPNYDSWIEIIFLKENMGAQKQAFLDKYIPNE